MKTNELSLKERWATLQNESPGLRIRDAARELGVSEAELLSTRLGEGVTRLEGDWIELIKSLPKLGRVMCLTRNEAAVHERYGSFEKIDFFHGMGQVLGPDIDLRLFMSEWKFGFAVTDSIKGGERQSLQFFDAYGDAVHKIYLQNESDFGSYGVLLHRFRAADQESLPEVRSVPAPDTGIPDAEVNVEGFQKEWLQLKDTHGFFPLLRKFKLGREQALRLAPAGHATPVGVGSVRVMLEHASVHSLPIMVFIGSRGCIQIHTGEVSKIRMFGEEWLNVLDPEFNMHLRLPLVKNAWIVKKPTTEGTVTSLELYDREGSNIALFFGKRKPGQPENEEWRELCAQLEVSE